MRNTMFTLFVLASIVMGCSAAQKAAFKQTIDEKVIPLTEKTKVTADAIATTHLPYTDYASMVAGFAGAVLGVEKLLSAFLGKSTTPATETKV